MNKQIILEVQFLLHQFNRGLITEEECVIKMQAAVLPVMEDITITEVSDDTIGA